MTLDVALFVVSLACVVVVLGASAWARVPDGKIEAALSRSQDLAQPPLSAYEKRRLEAVSATCESRRWWATYHATCDRGAAATAVTWQHLARQITREAEPLMTAEEAIEALRWQSDSDFRRQIFERDCWTCHLCGHPVVVGATQDEPERIAQIDHLVPRSLGGSGDLDNLATACMPCNEARSNHPDIDAIRLAVSVESSSLVDWLALPPWIRPPVPRCDFDPVSTFGTQEMRAVSTRPLCDPMLGPPPPFRRSER